MFFIQQTLMQRFPHPAILCPLMNLKVHSWTHFSGRRRVTIFIMWHLCHRYMMPTTDKSKSLCCYNNLLDWRKCNNLMSNWRFLERNSYKVLVSMGGYTVGLMCFMCLRQPGGVIMTCVEHVRTRWKHRSWQLSTCDGLVKTRWKQPQYVWGHRPHVTGEH